jgi:hypothetical protein|tara:strand:- start:45214 stop:45645 length:432 start_codon:yes stop_codon:yes gene_type:complete
MAGGGKFRKFLSKLPFAGDIINVGLELANPQEKDIIQKLKNAAFVGGGGLVASGLTGGADAIPAFMELAGVLGEDFGAPKGPKAVNDAFTKAPALNIEHYLRLAAYGGRHKPTEEILEAAGHPGGFKRQIDIPRPSGLIMPRF